MNNKVRGSLYIKNGLFYARVYYYVDGKRKTKDQATKVSVEGGSKRKTAQNRRAAEQFLADFLASFKIHGDAEKDNCVMLVDTAQEWLNHISASRAPGTVSSYAYIVKDISIYFGTLYPMKTTDVTSLDVERYLAWERMRRQPGYHGEYGVTSRSADGSGIENTVHHRYTGLRSILQFAKREGTVTNNVASSRDNKIDTPRPQKQEFPILTIEEAANLLNSVGTEPLWFQTAIYLALMYGLRRSEIIGLQEEDIDWSAKILTIRRTVTQQTIDHKNLVTSKPFTKNRKPKIFDLDEHEAKLLDAMVKEHQCHKEQFGTDYDNTWDGYIIRYPDGKLVHPNSLTQQFRKFLQRNNLKNIRLHDLRHTCASILCENGVDVKTIQAVMGHQQLSTTMMYLHYSKERKTAALTQMRGQIRGNLEETEN